jgi:hypothetical protein
VLKINRMVLLGLAAPVVAVAALALAPVSASAAACRVLTYGTASQEQKATCNNPPVVENPQNLREAGDGTETTPISTNFPTSVLAANTAGGLRYGYFVEGIETSELIPRGYVDFGVKLEHDPESSTTACNVATGSIPWFDASNGQASYGQPSAMVAGAGAWTLSIYSDSAACKAKEKNGEVIIRNVSLLLETLGERNSPEILTGTLVGHYVQPSSAICPAGGIELENVQRGLTSEPSRTAMVFDNGTEHSPAFLCFVGANNYVFPTAAPTWAPFTNSAEKEKVGIWKD